MLYLKRKNVIDIKLYNNSKFSTQILWKMELNVIKNDKKKCIFIF